jgi:cytochrome c oxidase subunit 2
MSGKKVFTLQKAFLTIALLAGFALAGCAGSPTWFEPASTNASLITNLGTAIFAIAIGVFVVVETLLVISVVRFSRKRDGEPAQIEGNTRFEIAWTAAPAIVLAVVFVLSLQTLTQIAYSPTSPGNASNAPATANAVHVRVVGHQWWWEFQYPELNIATANELHVPVNTVVNFDLESVDVIHSFWVPQLAGKTDVIPGHVNHTWFQANQLGTFHGQCAEFCGLEHALMRFEVVVEAPDQFQAWVKKQQAPVAVMTSDAARGEQLFLNGACIGCHTVNGTKALGKVGPNLTHLASRKLFAGAVFDNNADNLKKWLANPPAIKPGTSMPNLNLAQSDIDALVAYLMSLR